MTIKISFLTICIACFLIISSCSENSHKTDEKDSDELADSLLSHKDSSSTIIEEEQETSYNLPSALQIAYVFKKSGASFIGSIPNKSSGANKYNISNFKGAINFGVYSSDLAYCIFNKKYQESKEYLKASKEIGSFLGLNQAFESSNLAQRFEKNIANEDSVVKIVSEVQLKTDLMFEQNRQKHITVIAFSGAWAEAVYIASEVYNKDKSAKVLASLLEQLTLSSTIIKALKVYEKSEKEIGGLISSIEKIHTDFNNIQSLKSAIEKDEDIDYSNLKVTEIELKGISKSVNELRKSIVE